MAQIDQAPTVAGVDEPESRPGGIPLYIWVIAAVILAIPVGLFWGEGAEHLNLLPRLIIRALSALAAPLVVLAILSAIVSNDIRGRQGALMMIYYLINTVVAMGFGLVLSNLIRPGLGAKLIDLANPPVPPPRRTVTDLLVELVPRSVGDAFAQNNLAQLVLLTLALAIGLVKIRNEQQARGETTYKAAVDVLNLGFELLMRVLLWVVALVPLAVFGVVASSVGQREGIQVFNSLIWLIVVVLIGLSCQVIWYLVIMAIFGRMSPLRFLRGATDVMASTFSTSSTAATMPVTLRALSKLGVSRESSQLAACVGTNFNNDGTALYQATAVLFMAQALGFSLTPIDQLIIVLTTLVASVGAGGIPSGSFVTLPLIFAAVGLPADKIPVLLTIDWFLDRCRTTSNVLGDMTVAVLLDRTHDSAKPSVDDFDAAL
ncbi:dicarboxylate/amino acid:cation symporter [Singulisphaera acidiphila]|uniref:Na+/H+ dicarboxylate symporter n=1 Tax=Singulisphaera acidiphila (strain ATCC BAA-1392 / DSM 18658 / VKM B-2454 / MOB10) TaxID=886293 RepID=L0DA39_SINAD|nr:dicarboxylate/amino acid:cation symporter [Singulisphaera acidiphila]AGA26112.1 Na+/H+ dicarboxylate symporter [Singulisphaera acidiphila DSM 18658]